MNRYSVDVGSIYNEDCLKTMSRMSDGVIDLTVTSPPYDNLRSYHGYSFDFERIARELFRVTKPGGVIVWVVGDSTIARSETGTSFKQALFFKEIGLLLYDTMIFMKHGMPTDPRLRYFQRFEYMFVLSKGKPSSYNPIADVRSSDRKGYRGVDRKGDVLLTTEKKKDVPRYTVRGNVWKYDVRNMNSGHPASFPDSLARDHILSWSTLGDVVYDPFCGSGTTPAMAVETGRRYIGSEIAGEYCELSRKRISDVRDEMDRNK